jgi:Thioesterase superfamily
MNNANYVNLVFPLGRMGKPFGGPRIRWRGPSDSTASATTPPEGRLAVSDALDRPDLNDPTAGADPEMAAAYLDLVDATRGLLVDLALARPEADLSRQIAGAVRELSAQLAQRRVGDARRLGGRLRVPGRGQSFVPALAYDTLSAQSLVGRVTFSQYYAGMAAAHGGAPALILDEIFGQLAASAGGVRIRTAFLHVNYRNITPMDRELTFDATVDRVEGRKIFMTGTLRDGPTLLCDAECLYVQLRDGAP